MNNTIVAFYLLLISCAFALSIFISRSVGNIIVLLSYSLFFIVAVTSNNDLRLGSISGITIPYRADPALLYPTGILYSVFVIGFVRVPSFDAFLRLGAFTVISAITLFVVPAVVSREQAFRAIGTLGAVSVAISFLSLICPDCPLFDAGAAQTSFSFFDGVSYFRVLATIGAVCSGALFVKNRNLWMGVACLFNLFGVFLGFGRATILGLATTIALAAIYRIAGSKALVTVTAVGFLSSLAALAIAAGLIPGPTATLQSILGKRIGYWTASYEAFTIRPFLGWGLADTTAIVSDFYPPGTLTGVHNSYLRMFVIGGVVGGVSYLILSISALAVSFRGICERVPLALSTYCLIAGVLVIQLFTGGTIFGTNISSVLWALAIGYAQPGLGTTN